MDNATLTTTPPDTSGSPASDVGHTSAAPLAQHAGREPGSQSKPRPRRALILRLLTSVWVGIILMTLILIYATVFSAFAPIRGVLEITEMQAFGHWLFVSLVTAFLVSLFSVTFARIAWRRVNAGALISHIGLLLLAIGAIAYFGSKIEGAVLLESPRIELWQRGETRERTAAFLAAAGEAWSTPFGAGDVRIRVVETSGAGLQPVTSATLEVETPGADPRTIELSPGSAAPLFGALELRLVTAPPQQTFYDRDETALHIFSPTSGQAAAANLVGLPIYRERYLPGEGPLFDTQQRPVPSRRTTPALDLGPVSIPTGWFEPWRMPIEIDDPALPFRLRVTGYLPYVAGFRTRLDANGAEIPGRYEPVIEPVMFRVPLLMNPRQRSAIRVEISDRAGDWRDTRWLPFEEYLTGPRIADPLTFRMPGGDDVWQLTYARRQYPLGFAIAGKALSVEHFPGRRAVTSWRSDIRVRTAAGDMVDKAVYTNQTQTVAGWTLFQSGAANDGWSFTVLGVGNRNGILLMNVGWVLTAIGCIYAFYIKPVLLRKRRATNPSLAAAPGATA